MATSQNIIDRATAILRVRTSGVSYVTDDPNKNADAFIVLQDLIGEWGEDSTIDIPAPTTLSATLSIPKGTERALAWNLAADFGPEVGRAADQVILGKAKAAKDRLRSQTDMDISVDMSDISFTFGGRYNIATDR